jgi:hypothetical protein
MEIDLGLPIKYEEEQLLVPGNYISLVKRLDEEEDSLAKPAAKGGDFQKAIRLYETLKRSHSHYIEQINQYIKKLTIHITDSSAKAQRENGSPKDIKVMLHIPLNNLKSLTKIIGKECRDYKVKDGYYNEILRFLKEQELVAGARLLEQEAMEKGMEVHYDTQCDLSDMFPIIGNHYKRIKSITFDGKELTDICESVFKRLPKDEQEKYMVVNEWEGNSENRPYWSKYLHIPLEEIRQNNTKLREHDGDDTPTNEAELPVEMSREQAARAFVVQFKEQFPDVKEGDLSQRRWGGGRRSKRRKSKKKNS